MKKLLITIVLAASASVHAQIASDVASNYGGGNPWVNGSNGGSGFGAWSLNAISGNGSAGNFVGNPADGGISGMATSSFGLFANPTTSGATTTASRALTSALTVGQTLSVQWGVNFDSNGSGSKGFNLYSGGIGGTELININMGGTQAITISGNATFNTMFNNYGTAAMTIGFEYVNATTLRVFGTGRDGSESYNNNFTIGAAPDSFQFYATALDAGDNRQPYFNNLSVVPEPSTAGLALLGLAAFIARRKTKFS